jgi:hypothetical protein
MEPYESGDDVMLLGTHAYRLMILTDGQRLRVVEETTGYMLSAPAYSPDGQQLCYFRIPLLTAQSLERLKKHVDAQDEAQRQGEPFAWPAEPGAAATAPATTPGSQVASFDDRALPTLRALAETFEASSKFPTVPTTLVVRDARTDSIVSTARIELPVMGAAAGLPLTYVTLRPQFSPDGKRVYVCVGNIVAALDAVGREHHGLAAAVTAAALSPDGKLLAVVQPGALGFVQTDGQAARYVRWEKEISPAGLTWADSQTVALLEPSPDGPNVTLHLIRPDGTVRQSVVIRLPEHGQQKDENMGALALAPNGQYLAIAFKNDAFFVKSDGTALGHWQGKDETLAQPVFAPDSKQVAFKCLQSAPNEAPRAAAIVFFTPEGKELARVAIPSIKPGTTRPAEP